MTKKRYTIYIDSDLMDRVDEFCSKVRMSRNEVISEALEDYLKSNPFIDMFTKSLKELTPQELRELQHKVMDITSLILRKGGDAKESKEEEDKRTE